jgi:hypothetical protein
MASQREIRFWRRHADKGALLLAVRIYPARARKFFGAIPAMQCRQNLLDLILKMQISAASSPDEILAGLKTTWKEELSRGREQLKRQKMSVTTVHRKRGSEAFTIAEHQLTEKDMKDMAFSQCTPEFAAGVKKSAEQLLRKMQLNWPK